MTEHNENEYNEEYSTAATEYLAAKIQLGIESQDEIDDRQRAYMRYKFDSPDRTILLRIGEDTCSLVDVSIGGLSFNSRQDYPVGEQLHLNFDERYEVDVVVTGVTPEKVVPNGGERFIRHGVKFLEKRDGYKCTLTLLAYNVEIQRSKF